MNKEIVQNKSVKVFLKSGQVIEGILIDWDENELVLAQNDGEGLIVLSPYQNVLMIKILKREQKIYDEKSDYVGTADSATQIPTIPMDPVIHYPKTKEDRSTYFKQSLNVPKGGTAVGLSARDKHYLKICQLADLKKEQTKLENEIVTRKVKDFEPNGLPLVKYQSPFLN